MISSHLLAMVVTASVVMAQTTTEPAPTQTEEAPALCTEKTTVGSITGTTITDYEAFITSVEEKFSYSPLTGFSVTVHSTVTTFPEIPDPVPLISELDSGILERAGVDFVSSVTSAEIPCPTEDPDEHDDDDDGEGEEECEPHGDHWHCPPGVEEPPYDPGEECEPHGDHWHCPPGVEEPPFKPGEELEECEPHGDHWHCPPGVEEPPYAPGEGPEESTSAPAPSPSPSNGNVTTPTISDPADGPEQTGTPEADGEAGSLRSQKFLWSGGLAALICVVFVL